MAKHLGKLLPVITQKAEHVVNKLVKLDDMISKQNDKKVAAASCIAFKKA